MADTVLNSPNIKKLSAKDFRSDQENRWCPGCGDHGILNSVQKALADMEIKKEDYAVISGIGCSSRFPYYMDTYGFHTIHGRAAAIASGVKCANPDLEVIQVSGDGDALAIGGNHFIHAVRRNIDMTILLFNNEIYGLTKGQYSPTSNQGMVTKTSPFGTIEEPFKPAQLALGAQSKFYARSIDTSIKLTTEVVKSASAHKGTSIVEILQNCVIYNDGTHALVTDKATKDDYQLILEQDKPMIFGIEKNKGLILGGNGKLIVVTIGEHGITEADVLVHDAHTENPHMHWLLSSMMAPEYPVALGVIRDVASPSYDEKMVQQIKDVQALSSIKNMDDLLNSGDTWVVE
ncbi:2-oxoacid:ferredoxin oxidoreductase subunit beta [Ancylomarina euxinus]|uniref:2-oxoacid:ferredoxin oxidoreductase subunit beta n=1 Tax=Ancylomarina euxinus TaxID=2283627 RepID=A0A425XXZ7_9BACT|nr:2-oxoacid:ferredoxin oxidoreductase subunit beta [Ancylomarina euxinus]MCZ4695884.1 2-oxoacid:ferredoxin oxidoreductase subunit beta [Ancylomarina euxinus]MUP16259.1 2-oxoacid:ferredoxin oxidoreductase subunit beta [Ancylomarina euxinus]RRG19631.1 2-oxoacid:ferredoxin oxidoreductase subunit beta [Ancylomarina euxinus]